MSTKELLEQLYSMRVIPLIGQIDGESVDTIKKSMFSLTMKSDEQIILFIDSSGGEVHTGFSLIDTMLMLRVPIIGVVAGACHSMAVPVLQACTKRFATKHSTFILHPLSSTRKYRYDDDFQRVTEDTGRISATLHQQYVQFVAKRSKKSEDDIDRICKQGDRFGGFLFTDDALEWGLIDEILPSEFTLFKFKEVNKRQIQLSPFEL